MKKLMLTTMVVGAFLFTNQTEAQIRVNVNLNIGRPSWGLPATYPGDYYYLPEIDTYYDIPQRQFVYFDGRGWVYATELPYMYRGYDLNRGYKVMINEPRPYLRADVYRRQYNRYYNTYRPQVVIAPRPIYTAPRYDNRYDKRYDNKRYDNDRNDNNRRDNDDKFNRGRENQHFDNKRNDNDRTQRNDNISRNNDRGNNGNGRANANANGNGRWKSERGRN